MLSDPVAQDAATAMLFRQLTDKVREHDERHRWLGTSPGKPPSPFDMQCDARDGSGPSVVLLRPCKRGLEAAEIPDTDSGPPPQKRLRAD